MKAYVLEGTAWAQKHRDHTQGVGIHTQMVEDGASYAQQHMGADRWEGASTWVLGAIRVLRPMKGVP